MLDMMEVNSGNSHSKEKRPLDHSKSAIQGKKTTEKEVNTSVFVNYGKYV